jgi:hypothetical protein
MNFFLRSLESFSDHQRKNADNDAAKSHYYPARSFDHRRLLNRGCAAFDRIGASIKGVPAGKPREHWPKSTGSGDFISPRHK